MEIILEKGKVTFKEAIRDFWKGYFDFRGRSKRSGYWWAVLFTGIVYIILRSIGIIGIMSTSNTAQGIGIISIFALMIFILITILPNLMLSLRRWRDVGLSNKGITIYFVLMTGVNIMSHFYTQLGKILSNLFSIISIILYLLPSDQLTIISNNVVLKFLFRQRKN